MRFEQASYLLRFDDLCPTMSKARFDAFMAVVERHKVRPILAVVPDNQDPELTVDDPDPEFWNRMRILEAAGSTIALHGYRHLCSSSGRSLLRLHPQSEFAGIPEPTQRQWIHKGLEILHAKGLSPRLFVAPRHGFDAATLHALRREDLRFLSDGFASRPFTRGGVHWIPQQLWEPVKKPRGLWTICIHTNTARPELIEKLDLFLREHADQFITFDQVISAAQPTGLQWHERMREALVLQRVRRRLA